jgi:hypothetical protein
MTTWKEALREGAVSGSLASLVSTAYLVWAGHRHGHAAAPLNAVSHWFYGERALREDDAEARFTVPGYLTHHGAAIFWAVLHAKAWGAKQGHKKPLPAVAGALAASGVACFVDYQLTPRRLTPGFEHRLARTELANVYLCFAAGLALGTLLMRRR